MKSRHSIWYSLGMAKNNAELIKVTGERIAISPANKTDFKLKEAAGHLQCDYIEVVNVGQDRILIVDEEGLLNGKPINPTASFLFNSTIVGDVILCDSNMLL